MRFGGENEPKSLEPVAQAIIIARVRWLFNFLTFLITSYYPKLLIVLRVLANPKRSSVYDDNHYVIDDCRWRPMNT